MAKNDDTTIDIPPAEDATISGATFTFDVSSACTVCFGTADPEGSFGELENQTYNWTAGSTHQYPVPPDVGATLPYNTSQGTPCSVVEPSETVRTIHVGSSLETTSGKAKAKTAKKAKPKTKATLVSKAKSAPKTKAKAKSKSKPKPKTKAKPMTKAKPKPKTKAKAKKGAKSRT